MSIFIAILWVGLVLAYTYIIIGIGTGILVYRGIGSAKASTERINEVMNEVGMTRLQVSVICGATWPGGLRFAYNEFRKKDHD